MAFKMTNAERAELTNVVRKRYRAAAGADKSKILDEFIAVTGMGLREVRHQQERSAGRQFDVRYLQSAA